MDDNADLTLLTPEVFELRATEAVTLEGEEAIFMEQIQWSAQYDDPVVKALKALDAGELRSDEWMCTEGVVLYQGRVYVPDNPQLCHDLVHMHHRAIVTGHPRQWKTLELVPQNYWWPSVDGEVVITMLLILTLPQLKNRGVGLRERLSHVKLVLPMTRQP